MRGLLTREVEVAIGILEILGCPHVEMQVVLQVYVVEPLLLGLLWEEVHLDVSEFAVIILELGTVLVEGGTRLWPGCEEEQTHEADAVWGFGGHNT